jgi:hypothetical protein
MCNRVFDQKGRSVSVAGTVKPCQPPIFGTVFPLLAGLVAESPDYQFLILCTGPRFLFDGGEPANWEKLVGSLSTMGTSVCFALSFKIAVSL